MFLSNISVENFRCFGEGSERLELTLRKGLTALVGENDCGKSALIDALRFALGTTDQEWYRLEDSDFHTGADFPEIRIICRFEGLAGRDLRAFVEYLTHSTTPDGAPCLIVNWTAKNSGEIRKGRPYRRIEVHAGKDAKGPTLPQEVRELLQATYLRPLRDAEQALSSGRGSRLAQVLRQAREIKAGEEHDETKPLKDQNLSVSAIGKLMHSLLQEQRVVTGTREEIDRRLADLTLQGDSLTSSIHVSGANAKEDVQLRELLEKLDLRLGGDGKRGLGSNNALFMACELLLLSQPEDGLKLLLIEEPEAHLHAQRQLRVMKYLQEQAELRGIQVIVTTHSPNLASAVELQNMVMLRSARAFALASEHTLLDVSDYRFLQRFLDATKANLFFARGVLIVEGDAENILIPSLARLIGRDFTKHGVSIVNVGGVGLRRYARVFLRKDEANGGALGVPVACVTDMDVMPDCAPVILGRVEEGKAWPEKAKRRWRAKQDFDASALSALRSERESKASGQQVRTFVAGEWTLEYDLAIGPRGANGQHSCGLAEAVFIAAYLAYHDGAMNEGTKARDEVTREGKERFDKLLAGSSATDGCSAAEVLGSNIYAKFSGNGISKAIAAQYLAELLEARIAAKELKAEDLRSQMPPYLVGAIEYVTGGIAQSPQEIEATIHD